MKLDSEEQEILEAFSAGTLNQSSTATADMALAPLIARNTRLKNKHHLHLALEKSDVDLLTIKAAQQGMPRDTLIAGILHQYAVGSYPNLQSGEQL